MFGTRTFPTFLCHQENLLGYRAERVDTLEWLPAIWSSSYTAWYPPRRHTLPKPVGLYRWPQGPVKHVLDEQVTLQEAFSATDGLWRNNYASEGWVGMWRSMVRSFTYEFLSRTIGFNIHTSN
jgi:hypothetical protein